MRVWWHGTNFNYTHCIDRNIFLSVIVKKSFFYIISYFLNKIKYFSPILIKNSYDSDRGLEKIFFPRSETKSHMVAAAAPIFFLSVWTQLPYRGKFGVNCMCVLHRFKPLKWSCRTLTL